MGVFADNALVMRSYGLAVLPVGIDKRPLIGGFGKWIRPPNAKSVAQLAERFPDANVAILPGPSGLFVADVDDLREVRAVEALLGRTPLQVRTSRGKHLYYRAVPSTRDVRTNLRQYGYSLDLKFDNSVVIAPPSRHASGIVYRHERGAGWDLIKSLPRPDLDQLCRVIDSGYAINPRRTVEGERWTTLNDILCANAWSVDCYDELLDFAHSRNDGFEPPMLDCEVERLTRSVWKDVQRGKIVRYIGRTDGKGTDDLLALHRLAKNGPEATGAFALLALLTSEHAARCRRGETFAISVRRMAETQVLPRWTEFAYRRARNLLLKAHLIKKVAEHRGRQKAAQYILTRSLDSS